MPNNTNASGKKARKSVAKALTLTLAAAAVVPLLPAHFTKAEITQEAHAPAAPDTALEAASDEQASDEQAAVAEPAPAAPIEEEREAVAQPEVNGLNQIQNAATAEELQNALPAVELALNLTAYQTLGAEDQAQVAAALLNDAAEQPLTDSNVIQQLLNKAVAAQRDAAALRDAFGAVNSGADAAELKAALESPYLGLVLLNYRNLSEEGRLAAAAELLKLKPAGGFESRAELQKAFNAAIASVN